MLYPALFHSSVVPDTITAADAATSVTDHSGTVRNFAISQEIGSSKSHRLLLVFALVHLLAPLSLLAQSRESPPPNWPPAVEQLFFPDVRTTLQGNRPDYKALSRQGEIKTQTAEITPDRSSAAPNLSQQGTNWAQIISADLLEIEIKRRVRTIEQLGQTASEFRAGEYKPCRREFALLAVLMAVNHRHDERPRWHDVAIPLSRSMIEAADLCIDSSDRAYEAATVRKYQLGELIRGGRPELPPPPAAVARPLPGQQLGYRAEIMQRMEQSFRDTLKSETANKRAFRSSADEIAHEAHVLALLAEVIHQPGFDDADDSAYAQYARDLRDAAAALADAAEEADYSAASRAMVMTTRACSDCHADYRG